MSDRITNNNPGGLAGVIQQAIKNYAKDLHTCFPGVVTAFNPVLQIATVQPVIERIFKEGEDGEVTSLPLPPLLDVPIYHPKAGGFAITLPVAVGDNCLVFIAERSLDTWLTQGKLAPPSSTRMHHLSDAIAFMGLPPLPKLTTDYSPDSIQIRNASGDVSISIRPNGIIQLSSGTTEITMDKNGNISIDSPEVTFTGDVVIQGEVTVTGNAIVDGISFNDHRHSGVESGGGNSGGPWSP